MYNESFESHEVFKPKSKLELKQKVKPHIFG